MSERTGNLRRAASLLRRMDAIENGPHTYEGVTLHEIARDCVEAANDIVIYETNERIRDMAKVDFSKKVYECDVDESAGLADIIDLHDFSRRMS